MTAPYHAHGDDSDLPGPPSNQGGSVGTPRGTYHRLIAACSTCPGVVPVYLLLEQKAIPRTALGAQVLYFAEDLTAATGLPLAQVRRILNDLCRWGWLQIERLEGSDHCAVARLPYHPKTGIDARAQRRDPSMGGGVIHKRSVCRRTDDRASPELQLVMLKEALLRLDFRFGADPGIDRGYLNRALDLAGSLRIALGAVEELSAYRAQHVPDPRRYFIRYIAGVRPFATHQTAWNRHTWRGSSEGRQAWAR